MEKQKTKEDRGVAAVERGIEIAGEMGHKICHGHHSRENEGSRPGKQSNYYERPANHFQSQRTP
jgi:hypothetical protein